MKLVRARAFIKMAIREKLVSAGLSLILTLTGCAPRKSRAVPEIERRPLPLQPRNMLITEKSSLENKLTWEEFQEVKIESYRDACYFLSMMTYDGDWPPSDYVPSPKQTIERGWKGRCRNSAPIGALIAQKAGYEPIILYLLGDHVIGHMITLIEEKTNSGTEYGFIDGKYTSGPVLDSIDEVVALVNYTFGSGARGFTQYRKVYLNGKGVKWEEYEGNLLPIIDPEWYKMRQESGKYEKNSGKLNKRLKEYQKSKKALLERVKKSVKKPDELLGKLEVIEGEIK